jgi:hypothetical protein
VLVEEEEEEDSSPLLYHPCGFFSLQEEERTGFIKH